VRRVLDGDSTQDRAQDVVQGVIELKVLPHLARIRDEKLDTVVRQGCTWYIKEKLWKIDRSKACRDFGNTLPIDDFYHLGTEDDHEERLDTPTPLEEVLREALATLPEVDHDIVWLHLFARMTFAESGRKLDIGARQNVHERFNKIMARLRLQLNSLGVIDRTYSADLERRTA